MTLQPDLFSYAPPSEDQERLGWEERMLNDLQSAPIEACFPGFTGSILERLVTRGLALREDAGFMIPLDPMTGMIDDKPCTPEKAKRFLADYWKSPCPKYRYTLAS